MKKLKSFFLVLLMATVCLVIYYMVPALTGAPSSVTDDTTKEENTGNLNVDNSTEENSTEDNSTEENTTEDTQNGTENNTGNTEEPDDVVPTDKVTISLVAVGDNFAHESVINSGKQTDGTYNYDFLFEGIKEYVQNADIAAIFQTMIMAGNDKGLTGYPSFNTPVEMMAAIENAGFDVALMASNHSTDKDIPGIKDCLKHWKKYGKVKPVGIYSDKKESENIPIIEVQGKKIAVLNYTYGLNKPIKGKKDQYMVEYLGTLDEKTGVASKTTLATSVITDIQTAETMADYVIVFPYWGDEYTFTTGATEKEWAKKMTEAGADLIIGSHTHYIGEVEEITTDNGNKSLCYYSLGNFCSTFNNPSTMVGAMAKVNIVFDGEEVYIDKEGTGLIPIVTHYTHSGNADDEAATVVGVYPLSKYTSAMAASHGIKTRGKVAFSLEFVTSLVDEHVDDKYLLEE